MIAKRIPKKSEEQFIQGAAAGSAPEARTFQRVIINFDRNLLQRVDAAARSRGLNRSAYILSVLGEKLDL